MRPIFTNIVFAAASAALTVGVVLLPAPASASPADTITRQIDVHYGDLDIASPVGRATLRKRITLAAYGVCGTQESLQDQPAVAMCREQAIAGAERQIDVIASQNPAAPR